MARSTAARPDEIRRHNLGLVLTEVHRHGSMSRAELTQALRLNRSTIKALVSELADRGVVSEEVPVGNERAGRPSHLVRPRIDGPYAIAVDVNVDRLVTAAVGVGGRVLARRKSVLEPYPKPGDVITAVLGHISQLADEVPTNAWPIGIGVSIPGTIRRSDGRIEHAPNLHWRNRPFGSTLADALGNVLPVGLGNDADLGALAEHLRGAGSGSDDVLYLLGRIGVGAGIIIDGMQLHGLGGYAGEVGHVTLDPAGPPCHCGSNGCLETFVGESALLRHAGRDPYPSRESVAEVFAAARTGEPAAYAAVLWVGQWLGRALASLVNMLNPEVIIIGGSLAGVLDIARPMIEGELDQHAMAAARRLVALRMPALGEDASLLGAAELAFRSLLSDPVMAAATRSVTAAVELA